jgi:hypothetical protein
MGLLPCAISEIKVDYGDLVIDEVELFRSLGYADTVPNSDCQTIIDSLLKELSGICKPRFGFKIIDGEIVDRRLRLGRNWFNPDSIILHNLKNSTQYAIIIATVGAEMDKWIHNYRVDTDIMKAFVADTLGSVVAEAIVAFGTEYLSKQVGLLDLKTTNSYSPGYCGWNVSEQHKLFELLPPNFCGVTLCESSLMLPIKSVSSVVGIGENVVKREYGCAVCMKKDCYKRHLKKAQ